jgi:spore germination cell wall hydrolase CwlJ-like protein
MRSLSVTAFAATLFPSVLMSPVLESREPLKLRPTELHAPTIAALDASELVSATIPAAPPLSPAEISDPITSELSPAASQRPITTDLDKDLHCLALNIYHEARSEPLSGQIAVAQVTLNRVASEAFPPSVCEVVKQGGQKRNRCQFSWWCDGKSDQPTEPRAWRRSLELGRQVLTNQAPDPTDGALYYHADYVEPRWSSAFQRTAQIGRHLFYRPLSG